MMDILSMLSLQTKFLNQPKTIEGGGINLFLINSVIPRVLIIIILNLLLLLLILCCAPKPHTLLLFGLAHTVIIGPPFSCTFRLYIRLAVSILSKSALEC